MKPTELIAPDDRLRIEAAIADAERGTAGEVLVEVVQASGEYAHVPWRLGVLFAAVFSLGLPLVPGGVPLSLVFAAQLFGLALGLGLGRLPAVQHHLVSDEVQDARVAVRARRAFAEHGLRRTVGGTGVLLFVSLLERRVVVLADDGMHHALGPDERWEDVVELVLAGIRERKAAAGLEAAVRRCGEILARVVPPTATNPNEIRNLVILED